MSTPPPSLSSPAPSHAPAPAPATAAALEPPRPDTPPPPLEDLRQYEEEEEQHEPKPLLLLELADAPQAEARAEAEEDGASAANAKKQQQQHANTNFAMQVIIFAVQGALWFAAYGALLRLQKCPGNAPVRISQDACVTERRAADFARPGLENAERAECLSSLLAALALFSAGALCQQMYVLEPWRVVQRKLRAAMLA